MYRVSCVKGFRSGLIGYCVRVPVYKFAFLSDFLGAVRPAPCPVLAIFQQGQNYTSVYNMNKLIYKLI